MEGIGLDLGVEDVVDGLDALGADLEASCIASRARSTAITTASGRWPCRRRATARRCGGLSCVFSSESSCCASIEPKPSPPDVAPAPSTGVPAAAHAADAADAPLGAVSDDGGIDRHQRRMSSVFENIGLAVCIAVTFAS